MPFYIGRIPSGSSEGGGTDQGPAIAALQSNDASQDALISAADQRITELENNGGGVDYSPQIQALQNKDAAQDTLISAVDTKADSVAQNNVILDQRISTLEDRPAPTDYSSQITAIQAKDVLQDSRITALDGNMLNKASLVSGKVPYSQLPEFPVGRKVNVANQAARFALSMYTDLTIAYQSDTGDAWGLDANADPAISANWSKLGNAQGIGVASFNGRTGNIGPMSGDYDTGQITELVVKRFVTTDQIAKWDATSGAVGVTSFKGRSGAVVPVSGDYTADLVTESSTKKFVTPTQITSWDGKETTTGSQTKATTAQTAATSAAKTYADSTFVPLTQKAAVNGVASLGSDGKVPAAQLPTVTSPIWRVNSTKVVGTWYTNSSGNVMFLNLRTAASTATSRFLNVQTRANSTATSLHQRSTAISTATEKWIQLLAVVPPGWQYMVDTFGGSTTANTEFWHEMS